MPSDSATDGWTAPGREKYHPGMKSMSPMIRWLSALAAVLMFVLAAVVTTKWLIIVLAGVGGVGVSAVVGSLALAKSGETAGE
jgi:hypothetical protein